MKTRKTSFLFSAWLLVGLISLFSSNPGLVAGSTVLRVPQEYATIQGAINAASSGDTILVAEGTYHEQLSVQKSVFIIGQNKLTTIIEGNGTDYVIHVLVPFVRISGFTIKKGYGGIHVIESNTTISDNIISANTVGVLLSGANFSMVSRNIVTSNNLTGISLGDAYNNTITSNIVSMNKGSGIGLVYSSNNTIMGNTINSNIHGTKLIWNSMNNTVISNNLMNNTNGIVLEDSSNDNVIYHNNFVNNTKQAISVASSNRWDNGYPSGGNYWSSYTGVDLYNGPYQNVTGSDGIGDTPYTIDTDKDNYPHMNQLEQVTDLTPPTTSNNYDGSWHTTDFVIVLTVTDDLSGPAETYYKINGAETRNISTGGQPFITTENANNTLEYWSTDLAGNTEEPHEILTGIKLDKTNPSVSFITPLNGSEITSSTLTVTWTGSDETSGISYYQVRLDSGSFINMGLTTFNEFTNIRDGNHQISVKAFDNAGRSRINVVKLTVNASATRLAKDLELAKWVVVPIVFVIIALIAFQYRKKRMKGRQGGKRKSDASLRKNALLPFTLLLKHFN